MVYDPKILVRNVCGLKTKACERRIYVRSTDMSMTYLQEPKLSAVSHSAVPITAGIDFDGFYYLSTSDTREAMLLHE